MPPAIPQLSAGEHIYIINSNTPFGQFVVGFSYKIILSTPRRIVLVVVSIFVAIGAFYWLRDPLTAEVSHLLSACISEPCS